MKIFNIKQIDIFIREKATPIGAGLGNKNKTYIDFEENKVFKDLMKRWMAKEF